MADSAVKRLEERIAYELLLIAALVGLALVQITLLPSPLEFPPALVLVVVLCRVLVGSRSLQIDNGVDGVIRWAFYGGLGLDVFSTAPFGSHALALVVATSLIALLTRRLQIEGFLLPAVAIPVGVLVYETILALIYALTVAPLEWQSYAGWVILPGMVAALVIMVPIFALMRWFIVQRG
ncbi:MAG: rod shape-determining protein MreD [Chloroflexaceae bacterium]|jgi:rod shape-determining protein MreD|nr:rod shape-determining protein MreD [Chloroflexaceae bacterium]